MLLAVADPTVHTTLPECRKVVELCVQSDQPLQAASDHPRCKAMYDVDDNSMASGSESDIQSADSDEDWLSANQEL